MNKKIGNYISKRNAARFMEVDFHDFIDMVQTGLSDEEIAVELGVNREYIEKLKNELYRDY